MIEQKNKNKNNWNIWWVGISIIWEIFYLDAFPNTKIIKDGQRIRIQNNKYT